MSELPISPKKEKDCEVPLNSHGCAPTHHAEPRDWMASFCGCFDDCCGCLDVWCCLHCQISRQWSVAKDHKVGFNIPICLLLHFLPCTICCVGASVRSSTRERYNIKGNTCADCCAVYCCTLCAISQIMREMTMMNEFPASNRQHSVEGLVFLFKLHLDPFPFVYRRYVAAYPPFFPPFFLLKAWLVFFRMGNREHALSFLFFQSLRVISLYQSSCDRGSTYGTAIWWEKKLSLKTSKFSLKTSKFQDANTVLSLPTPLALPTLGTRPQGLSYQYFVAALLEVVQIMIHKKESNPIITSTLRKQFFSFLFFIHLFFSLILPQHVSLSLPRILTPFLNSITVEGLLALSNLLWPPTLSFGHSLHSLSPSTRVFSSKATHAYSQPQTKPKYFRQNMSELPISPKKEKDCEVPLNSHALRLLRRLLRLLDWSVAKDHKVGFNIPICLLLHFLPCTICCVGASVRSSTRERYNIKGNTCADCCAVYCCTLCAISQIMREMTMMNERYVAAYPLFPPFFLLKAWLVFFRMGNREHALSFLFFQSLRVISLYQSSCDRGSTYGTAIWWEKKLSLKTSKFSLKTSKFQDANTVLSLPTPLALPTLGTRPQGLSYQYFVAALLEVVQISAPPESNPIITSTLRKQFFSFLFFIHLFFSLILPQHVSLSLPRILTPFLNSITVEGLLALSNLLWPPTLSFGHSLHSLSPSTRVFSSKATHAYSQPQTKPKYFRQNMSELPISPKKEKDCEVPLNSHALRLLRRLLRLLDWSVAKDHKVGFNIPICLLLHFLPCTICCVGASVRSSTRERYNIKGNTCADCCAVYCCTLCAISQIMREMTMMNERYVAAYPPFFPPFFLLKAWLVFFRMGNREHALSFLFFQSLRVISLYQSSCDRGSTYGTAIWWLVQKKAHLLFSCAY
eukprot:gene12307-8448_t